MLHCIKTPSRIGKPWCWSLLWQYRSNRFLGFLHLDFLPRRNLLLQYTCHWLKYIWRLYSKKWIFWLMNIFQISSIPYWVILRHIVDILSWGTPCSFLYCLSLQRYSNLVGGTNIPFSLIAPNGSLHSESLVPLQTWHFRLMGWLIPWAI